MAEVDLYNLKKVGKFYHCDFVVRGIRVHKSTKRAMIADAKTEAKRWYDAALDKSNGVVPAVEIPTLDKALTKWVTANRGVLSDKHVDGTKDKMELHFADLMETPLDQLTTERVGEIRSSYLNNPGPTGRNHKGGGANSLIKALNTVMGWASTIWPVPSRPYKLKKVREEKLPRRVVPLADTAAFLAAVDAPHSGSGKKHAFVLRPKNPHVLAAVRLMLGLGLREAEALNSRWEWLDTANRTYYAGKTKNGQVRLIPVPDWLMDYLKPSKDKHGLILPEDGDVPHKAQFTKKVLQQVGAKLALPGLTPHRLRATFATNHARVGTPIPDIQVWLGHEHIETTMLYIEFVSDGGHAAQDRVATMMGFSSTTREYSPGSHQ